jgi:hypothetical protein
MLLAFLLSLLLHPLPQTPSPPSRPSHQAWNALLQRFVSPAGVVDYPGFRSELTTLDAYLQHLRQSPPADNWPRNDRMAYWINLYNAATVRLIASNYPLKSIMDLDGGKTWDVPRVAVGPRTYSLNQIENDILRKQFEDPRIHFALNCAAKSCPPLLNQAFLPDNLDAQLDARTRLFVNNPSANRIEPRSASISRIFDWYAADFGNLPAFLNRYAKAKLPGNARITFLDYDWSLNDR